MFGGADHGIGSSRTWTLMDDNLQDRPEGSRSRTLKPVPIVLEHRGQSVVTLKSENLPVKHTLFRHRV